MPIDIARRRARALPRASRSSSRARLRARASTRCAPRSPAARPSPCSAPPATASRRLTNALVGADRLLTKTDPRRRQGPAHLGTPRAGAARRAGERSSTRQGCEASVCTSPSGGMEAAFPEIARLADRLPVRRLHAHRRARLRRAGGGRGRAWSRSGGWRAGGLCSASARPMARADRDPAPAPGAQAAKLKNKHKRADRRASLEGIRPSAVLPAAAPR